MIEDQPDLICRYRSDGTVIFANRAFLRFFGGEKNGAEGMDFLGVLCREGGATLERDLAILCRERPVVVTELGMTSRAGVPVWIQWMSRAVLDARGNFVEFQSVGRDITVLKQAEERLRISLTEKEVLLGEVHHRVKNNLQIISSILDMSGFACNDPVAVALIRDSRARVHAIALIHSLLMRSDRFDRIDMGIYVSELIKYLGHVHTGCQERISSEVEIRSVYLDMSQAVPFALVLHEILSNSFRHAFPGNRKGTIKICMHSTESGMIYAYISDDGVGISGIRGMDNPESFGLGLVRIIVDEQLSGSIVMEENSGVGFRIEFPKAIRREYHA
jgi:PAS domain S-box-containing protein